MISSFGVVLDACVLVPISLCDVLLSAADRRLYRPLWSLTILDEMERHAARMIERNGMSQVEAAAGAQLRRRFMVDSFPEAEVTGYESLVAAMPNDERDRHVLAAAVRASAQVIVTANMRHFPNDALAPLGVVAQTPDDFLKDLLGFEPDVMIDVICDMAASKTRPPMTPLDILKRVGKAAPDFASAALIVIEERDALA